MDRANKIICPRCGAAFRSVRGVPAGTLIACVQCGTSFAAGNQNPGAANPRPGAVRRTRLQIVAGAAALYLLGGAALAWYCFHLNAESPAPQAGAAQHDDGPPPTPPPPVPPLPPSPVSAEVQRKIDDAIVNGVWYLKEKQLATGSWGTTVPEFSGDLSVGLAALPGLTLLECGIPASDPIIEKAANYVRKYAPLLTSTSPYDTYQIALAILFLDRLDNYKDKDLIQYLALRLVAGQRGDGGWDYNNPPLDRKATAALLALLQNEKTTLDEWRTAAAAKGAPWPADGRSDNSNSQFAVLALWVARRHDVPIDRTVALVGQRFRQSQKPAGEDPPPGKNRDQDGSWWYTGNGDARPASEWPTMTCSGLLGLAIANGTAKDGPPPGDQDHVTRAFAMLGREIDRQDETRAVDLYYLWSLERVAVLYNADTIDGKNWYAWGVDQILPLQQQADGAWPEQWLTGHSPPVSTAFALLFLKRANLAKDLSKLQLLAPTK